MPLLKKTGMCKFTASFIVDGLDRSEAGDDDDDDDDEGKAEDEEG
jgi:hypothetical protein